MNLKREVVVGFEDMWVNTRFDCKSKDETGRNPGSKLGVL
jgi:hypothetical protein